MELMTTTEEKVVTGSLGVTISTVRKATIGFSVVPQQRVSMAVMEMIMYLEAPMVKEISAGDQATTSFTVVKELTTYTDTKVRTS